MPQNHQIFNGNCLKREENALDQEDTLSTARFAREVAKRHGYLKKNKTTSVQTFWTLLKRLGENKMDNYETLEYKPTSVLEPMDVVEEQQPIALK